MQVVVTGGTGFIGSRLALKHVGKGDQVRVFAAIANPHQERAAEALAGGGVDVVSGDIRVAEQVSDALRGADVVYHLAAAQHEAGENETFFREVNVDGVRNLFESAVSQNVGRVVHGSTIGVYGEADSVPVNEQSDTAPDNMYGRTKLEGEKLAVSYKDQISTVIVRISETYGPGDFRLLKMFRAINRGRFPLIGDGMNIHQLIFVDDLVDALMLAAERDIASGELFLLGGTERLTTAEMIHHVRHAVNRRRFGPRLPIRPLLLLSTLTERGCRAIGVNPPLSARRLDFFRKSFLLDCSKARHQLQFEAPTPFSRGAKMTCNWYQSEGLL